MMGLMLPNSAFHFSLNTDSVKSDSKIEYWTFYMKAINEFKQFEQLVLNPTKAREEMTENQIRAQNPDVYNPFFRVLELL
jgi:hypothetical protein